MSIDALQELIRKRKNPTMLALDPTSEVVPPHLFDEAAAQYGPTAKAAAQAYYTYCVSLLDALAELIPAVKVQSACFTALGAPGVEVMQQVLEYAKKLGYYVVLDALAGQVPHIAELTAGSLFAGIPMGDQILHPYTCDGVTLNGYLGTDSIQPYLPCCKSGEKSVFVLIRSSNKSATDVQELLAGGRLVYTAMADLVSRWGRDNYGKYGYSNVAAVVGLNQPQALEILRKKYDRIFFLVAGYGAQGGFLKNAPLAFDRFGHGAVIAAGRSILGAWRKQETDGRDYVAQALAAAKKMCKDLGKNVLVM